jgi:hypothetical protein
MDYRVASNIRGKSLSSLITDRISSGGSVGSSIKGAISDKLKARGTGIKEKFDPMNIARAMTGGGKLAPAILGKITGRSQSDINYFAGNKKSSTYTKMPSVGQVPSEGFGGSAIEVLNKMLSFMQKNREDDLTRKQTSMAFEEERQSEEQRRHDQFLKVLKDYTSLGGGTTTIVKKEEDGGFLSGLMDTIKSMISTAVSCVLTVVNGLIDGFKKSLEWLGDLKTLMSTLGGSAAKILLNLGRFLLSPFGVALLGVLAIGAFLKLIYDQKAAIEANPNAPEFRDNAYAMKLRGETKTVAQAGQANINKTIKSVNRPEIENAVKDNVPDDILIDLYGRDKLNLQKWLTDNPTVMKYQGPVAPIVGLPRTGAEAGEIARTLATPLPSDMTPSTAGAGRGSAEFAKTDPRRLDLQTPTTTPVPATPASSAVVGKIQENNDLNMQSTMTAGGSSSPSVSVNSSSTSAPDQTVTSTATTRDDTAILDFVMRRSKSPT